MATACPTALLHNDGPAVIAGEAPTLEKVFVYGSLKRGFRNHHVIRELGAEYLTDAQLPNALLFSVARGAYPGVVLHRGAPKAVSGELFHVTKEALRSMDTFEGHPHYYRRTEVTIVQDDNSTTEAWVYVFQHLVDAATAVPSGEWREAVGRWM